MSGSLPTRIGPRRSKYDYTSAGAYFITICTKGRQHYFGEIIEGKMVLNELGKYCYNCRNEIPKYYPFVTIDEFVVMPNHIHGILMIGNHDGNSDHKNTHSNRRDYHIRPILPIQRLKYTRPILPTIRSCIQRT